MSPFYFLHLVLTHGGSGYSTAGSFTSESHCCNIWISLSEAISEGLLGLQSYDNVPIILRCSKILVFLNKIFGGPTFHRVPLNEE